LSILQINIFEYQIDWPRADRTDESRGELSKPLHKRDPGYTGIDPYVGMEVRSTHGWSKGYCGTVVGTSLDANGESLVVVRWNVGMPASGVPFPLKLSQVVEALYVS